MEQAKLTKKQRKAAAFRERKGKRAEVIHDLPETDTPLQEQDDDSHPPITEPAPKKRKRDTDEPALAESSTTPSKKRPKKAKDTEDGEESVAEGASKKKHRFILFVGNLSYRTTVPSIEAHFAACPEPPSVRLLTPKPRPGATVAKSKGCAFLEFPSARSLQAGLKFHHTELDGRTINVELTSGGGGGGEKRRETIRSRNKALETEREKKQQAAASKPTPASASSSFKKSKGTPIAIPAPSSLPQRHSTTSGAEHKPAAEKTWSVPQGDEEAGRGGVKHAKSKTRGNKKSKSKAWVPTGANAVVVAT